MVKDKTKIKIGMLATAVSLGVVIERKLDIYLPIGNIMELFVISAMSYFIILWGSKMFGNIKPKNRQPKNNR